MGLGNFDTEKHRREYMETFPAVFCCCHVARTATGGGSDLATGNLFCGEWGDVFVGDVAESIDFSGQLKPVYEGVEICTRFLFRSSEADIDDDERHIGYSEVIFGAFPQSELDGMGLSNTEVWQCLRFC